MRILLILCAGLLCAAPPTKTTYSFSTEPIDVVIPCIRKDLPTLERCIEGIKKNGKNIRRIIVLSPEPLTQSAEWFDENLFPFSKRDLAVEIFHGDERRADEYLRTPGSRMSWIFQQLLKFYTPFVIPDISSNVLILDADVIFLNATAFQNEQGGPRFIPAHEYERAYFEHAARLLPWIKRVNASHSGIAHHMLFQRPILEDLFSQIKLQHNTEPWKAICRCINPAELPRSCMSEYEIYFNFAFLRTHQATLNHAKWTMVPNLHNILYYQRIGQAFVACPEWYRTCNGF